MARSSRQGRSSCHAGCAARPIPDDSPCSQVGDIAVGQAKPFSEDLVVVLAEGGWWCSVPDMRSGPELDRKSSVQRPSGDGVLKLLPPTASGELRYDDLLVRHEELGGGHSGRP